jgi:hypothetical protein
MTDGRRGFRGWVMDETISETNHECPGPRPWCPGGMQRLVAPALDVLVENFWENEEPVAKPGASLGLSSRDQG